MSSFCTNWLALPTAAALCLSAPAMAAADSAPFDIQAQPLSDALRLYAAQGHMQLLYEYSAVENKSSNRRLQGNLDKRATLEELLRGSGLEAAYSNDGAVTVRPMADVSPSAQLPPRAQRLAAETSPAPAQTGSLEPVGLDEVVVTAERRVADVQDIGASVAVRSGDELSREGKTTVDQIIGDIPGISGVAFQSETGFGEPSFASDSPITGVAIRGVRANSGGSGLPNNATTAVYVDGVYGGVGGTYDIDRVEVLRGPQGTLYGRSATGGVIAFYTRDPNTNKFEGNASIEAGTYDLRHAGGAVNIPVLTDQLALRVSANEYRRDGYEYDFSSGYTSKVDDARLKALYTPTANLSVLLGVALENNTTYAGATRYNATGPDSWVLQTTPQFEGKASIEHRQYWSKISWNFGAATLIYQPSFRTFERTALIYTPAPGGGNHREDYNFPSDKFLTHELQLTSNPGSKFDWQVGAIYYNNDADFFVNYRRYESGAFSLQRTLNRDTTQYGVYGEATYPLTDKTRITAGLRRDKTEVAVEGQVIVNTNRALNATTLVAGLPENIQVFNLSRQAGTRNFDNTTFKLRLEQDLTQQNMVYAMVSSAFVPGDVAITSSTPLYAYAFSAETLTSYELGLKSRFFGNRLQINGAVYYYDYGGRQVNTERVPGDPSSTVTLVTPAKFTGAELETLYQLTDADRIGLEIGYVNAKYTHITPAWRAQFAYEDIGGLSPLTVKLSYDHDFTLPNSSKLRLGADARFTDSYLSGDVSTANIAFTDWYRVDSYIIGNVNLDWTSPSGRWGASGYVRNVADVRYKQGVTVSAAARVYSLSDPRIYGVSFRVKF